MVSTALEDIQQTAIRETLAKLSRGLPTGIALTRKSSFLVLKA